MDSFSLKPPYVLTRYYELGDLYRLLHNTYAFPELNAVWLVGVAIDVARGMRYLHASSPPLCHRDLKSPNIYITGLAPSGAQRAVVGDLGTVVPMFEARRHDVVPVTNPVWMAPELIERRPYSGAVDVYSFGIVLWELLTRHHPFDSLESASGGGITDDNKVMRAAIVAGQRPRADGEETLPLAGLRGLIARCWDGDAALRPSFDAAVDELVECKNQLVAQLGVKSTGNP